MQSYSSLPEPSKNETTSAAKATKANKGHKKNLKERKLAPLLTAAPPSPPPQLQGCLVQAHKLVPWSENKMLEYQLLLPVYLKHDREIGSRL